MFYVNLLKRIGPMFLNGLRKLSCYRLKNHQLIGLSGNTVTEFLQGIISNDINKLDCTSTSFMYSFLLNTKGRILTDSFVYKIQDTISSQNLSYMIEVDASLTENICHLLKMYNFRKKVKIWIEDDANVWIVLPSVGESLANTNSWPKKLAVPNGSVLFYAADPRAVPGWSGRILANENLDARQSLGIPCSTSMTDEEVNHVYTRLRYRLGIPEGPNELKPGVGLPLESNADLCGGVSFTKGCYVGQELTTRSHFTGVIRKRITPILLNESAYSNRIPSDAPIYHINSLNERKKQPIGLIRGIEEAPVGLSEGNQQNRWGIALLRLADAAEAIISGDSLWASSTGLLPDDLISVDLSAGVFVHPYAPIWWPETVGTGLPRLPIQ